MLFFLVQSNLLMHVGFFFWLPFPCKGAVGLGIHLGFLPKFNVFTHSESRKKLWSAGRWIFFVWLFISNRFYILFFLGKSCFLSFVFLLCSEDSLWSGGGQRARKHLFFLFFVSPRVVWKRSVCVPLLLSRGTWLFFFFLAESSLWALLCFLCAAGVRCSTSTVPFSSCQPPSQAWKLVLQLHKYFRFLGFWCFWWRFPGVLTQAGGILSHLPTSLSGICTV